MKNTKFWVALTLSLVASLLFFLCRNSLPGSWSGIERLLPSLVLLLLSLILLMWFGPKAYVSKLPDNAAKFTREKGKLEIEDEHRKTLAQVVGGGFLLVGLIFTYNSYNLSIRELDQGAAQLEQSKSGQMTERYTKAVTLIGSPDIETRLAGLYELERISKDSKKDDYWTIIQLMCAYVREKSQNTGIKNSPTKKVDTAIQAALNIIGKRKGEDPEGGIIDLRGANLEDADLTGLNFAGANLTDTDLTDATLKDTILSGATMIQTKLIDADISDTKFINADLSFAFLTGARLRKVDLTGAVFERTDVKGAKFFEITGLTSEQKKNALTNSGTVFPADPNESAPVPQN